MTALLTNLAGVGASVGPRAASPAPAILDTDSDAPALRFGETLRAQTSDGGGLLATGIAADTELQIDDTDILRQLTGTNTNAAVLARTRVMGGADDVSSDDANAANDGGEAPVSLVPLAPAALALPSTPVAATATLMNVSSAADVTNGAASARDAKAMSLVATPPSAPRGVMSGHPATVSVDDDAIDVSLLNVSTPQSGPATRALIGANATAAAASDQQSSNLLASQSPPLLMTLASGATDPTAQKTAGASKVADTPSTAPGSRQSLVDALGERLSVQLNRGSSQATVRLDPPMMGTIEIVIRQDAAGVQVHLSASHGDVLRQLHSIGSALSQDLVQRNHGDVTVHVSESSRDGDGRQRNRQGGSSDADSTPGHALRTADEPERAVAFTLA